MSQHKLYPHVYRPLQIGPIEVKNRLYQAPHGSFAWMAPPENDLAAHVYAIDGTDGSPIPHPDVIDYYEERARGGVGLIIQGHIEVQKGHSGRWHLTTNSATKAFQPLVERVHRHGAKIFAQFHCGMGSPSGIPGAGHVGTDGFPKPLSTHDIRRIVDLVALSTRNARLAGFDGVELHAAHLHSVGLFLSGFTNRRTDEYGGSLENRLRFPLECLEAMRENAGGTLAVGIRMPCDEGLPDGVDAEEAVQIVRRLEESGLVDFFDLDIGHSQHMWQLWAPHYVAPGWELPHINKVSAAIQNTPVLGCTGRMQLPDEADKILAGKSMDMVGGVRGLFADPEYPKKSEEGRAGEIRPCIGMNSCLYEGQCVMNPTNYLEVQYGTTKITKTAAAKRVTVIGGGPSGLEAARVAALRGHEVTLYERSELLGGALNLQAKLPTRAGVLEAAKWWEGRLRELGVTIVLETEATVDLVLGHDPDVAVVATGSAFDPTCLNGLTAREIPGWGRDFVYTPETLLPAVPERVRGNVVVYEEDGAMTASDVAWLLAERGASSVELVTRHPAPALAYIGRYGSHREIVQTRLGHLGVTSSPGTFIREIGDHQVTLFDAHTGADSRTIDDVSLVVLVTLRRPRSELADALTPHLTDVRVLGDAHTPGRMAKATRDGFMFGWHL